MYGVAVPAIIETELKEHRSQSDGGHYDHRHWTKESVAPGVKHDHAQPAAQ
jgi:hypothetical protein